MFIMVIMFFMVIMVIMVIINPYHSVLNAEAKLILGVWPLDLHFDDRVINVIIFFMVTILIIIFLPLRSER